MNRWCIISPGPRTGSTFVETGIHKKLYETDKSAVQLGEYLNSFTPRAEIVYLDPRGNLGKIVTTSKRTHPLDVKEFYNKRVELLLKGNINQSATMRIFCGWHGLSYEDYSKLFVTLVNHNFKFITLNRNIFDMTISHYFARSTKIIHRFEFQGKVMFALHSGADTESIDLPMIDVDLNEFKGLYIQNFHSINQFKKLCFEIYHIPISYETMHDDCKYNLIPIIDNPPIKKLYDKEYKDMIGNYQEVLDTAAALDKDLNEKQNNP